MRFPSCDSGSAEDHDLAAQKAADALGFWKWHAIWCDAAGPVVYFLSPGRHLGVEGFAAIAAIICLNIWWFWNEFSLRRHSRIAHELRKPHFPP